MAANDVIVDGVTLPPPAQGGIKYQQQLIWSKNAGRNTATAYFTGDIKAEKGTWTLSWNDLELTYAQLQTINNVFSRLGKPYFTITFTDDLGYRRTVRAYSAGRSSIIKSYRDDAGRITGVTVQIVER